MGDKFAQLAALLKESSSGLSGAFRLRQIGTYGPQPVAMFDFLAFC